MVNNEQMFNSEQTMINSEQGMVKCADQETMMNSEQTVSTLNSPN